MEVLDVGDLSSAGENAAIKVNLKLSQEESLNPGLLLTVEEILVFATAAAEASIGSMSRTKTFGAQGTIWAPSFVGVRLGEQGGGVVDWDLDVHLDYEVVDVPWMDWFIMWDFLDNVVNNERAY